MPNKGRGAQKAAELTSSPYKNDLEASQQKRKQPMKLKTQIKKYIKNTKEIKGKRPISEKASKDNENMKKSKV